MNRTLTATIAGLVLGGALLTGCGGDDEGEADDPGSTGSASVTTDESEPTEGTSTEATDPSEPAETDDPETDDPTTDDPETDDPDDTDVPDPTDGPETDDTDGPETDDAPANPEAAEFCAAFETAFDAIEDLGEDFSGEPGDQVPPAVVDALRTWGEDLAAADLPSDLPPDARAGVDVQSQLLRAIPDRLTFAELDGLESDLSPREQQQATATTEYATSTCDLF